MILRGDVTGNDDEGKAKEKTIATACSDDKWSRAVIDCVAGTARPQDCLDKLDEKQVDSFEKRLADWSTQTLSPTGSPLVECADAVGDGKSFHPPSEPDPWVAKRRRDFLIDACEHAWGPSLKSCLLVAGDDGSEAEACLQAELDTTELSELTDGLDGLDKLWTKIRDIRDNAAKITCKQVVATHYADATWKQKLDGYKPPQRKQMIADSRAAMTKSCTADKWSDTTRACIIVGGGNTCFESEKLRWGYPATGTVKVVGIAECDDYSAAVMKFTSCATLAEASRMMITRSLQQMLVEIARLPAAERAKMGANCKAAMETIQTEVAAAGC